MFTQLINWLIPITCVVCNLQSDENVCMDCKKELPWIINGCRYCANEITLTSHNLCGECLTSPPPINRNITLFHYKPPIISLITKLKFQGQLRYAQSLGTLLAQKVQQIYENGQLDFPDYIIPVPLHKKRLQTRGFNQALEIAKSVKKKCAIPIDCRSVKRIKFTQPQTLIKKDERQKNLRNAFTMTTNIKAQHIAIVDDVITTFSTISELTNTLRRAGVQKIDIWCIAKAHS